MYKVDAFSQSHEKELILLYTHVLVRSVQCVLKDKYSNSRFLFCKMYIGAQLRLVIVMPIYMSCACRLDAFIECSYLCADFITVPVLRIRISAQ